jgi:RNA polymerase sigma-70 factor (ECF subfamily)
MLAVRQENEPLPIQGAKAGESAAWQSLFHRFRLPLFVYVAELVQSREEALDIVQETFANAARYIGKLRDDSKFASWLFQISHQKCIRYLERRGQKASMELPLDEEENQHLSSAESNPRDWAIRKEDEEAFSLMLEQIPIAQRSVLLLHFVEDFSLEEIAEISAVPVGTVKSRMHHARKTLRKLLGKEKL